MDKLDAALEKVKSQMLNPEENVMPDETAPKKKVPTKKVAAAATNGVAKPAPKKKVVKPKSPPISTEGMVTLKELCAELKLAPTIARRYLRKDKVPNPGRWMWKAGSKELAAARKVLKA